MPPLTIKNLRAIAGYALAFAVTGLAIFIVSSLTVVPELAGPAGLWIVTVFSVLANAASLALPALDYLQRRRHLEQWRTSMERSYAAVADALELLASK